MAHSATVILPRDPTATSIAREWIRGRLSGEGLRRQTLDDVLLGTSELVSNVLEHTSSEPVLSMTIDDEILVEVADGSAGQAQIGEVTNGHGGGWGLRLVAEIADRWGSEPGDSGGKVVWFAVGPLAAGSDAARRE